MKLLWMSNGSFELLKYSTLSWSQLQSFPETKHTKILEPEEDLEMDQQLIPIL